MDARACCRFDADERSACHQSRATIDLHGYQGGPCVSM